MEELFELSQELARAGTTSIESSARPSGVMPRPTRSQASLEPIQYITAAHQLSARLVAIRARYQQKSGGK